MSLSPYLHTDPESEAADAMRMAAYFSDRALTSISYWKWVIIALDNCLQNLMVLGLKRGSSLSPLSDRSAKKINAFLSDIENYTGSPPEWWLDNFPELFEKIKSSTFTSDFGLTLFVPDERINESIKRLHERRNDFLHFSLDGWILYVTGLPDICSDCCKLVSFLGWESNNIIWESQEAKDELRKAHDRFVENMNKLKIAYRAA